MCYPIPSYQTGPGHRNQPPARNRIVADTPSMGFRHGQAVHESSDWKTMSLVGKEMHAKIPVVHESASSAVVPGRGR